MEEHYNEACEISTAIVKKEIQRIETRLWIHETVGLII